MRDYELTLVVSPEVSDEGLSAIIDKICQFVVEKGGNINDINRWGRRKLAYPIRRFSEGNYILVQFKLEPQVTAELESNLRLWDEVLRHLLVRSGE